MCNYEGQYLSWSIKIAQLGEQLVKGAVIEERKNWVTITSLKRERQEVRACRELALPILEAAVRTKEKKMKARGPGKNM